MVAGLGRLAMILNSIRTGAPGRAAARGGTTAASGAQSSGFSPVISTPGAAASQPVAAVASLDALVALQTIDNPLERRAKAARRGSAILDDLEALKLALLEGAVDRRDLERLRRIVRSAREASDDSGLEALIDGIELRAEVELAKLGG